MGSGGGRLDTGVGSKGANSPADADTVDTCIGSCAGTMFSRVGMEAGILTSLGEDFSFLTSCRFVAVRQNLSGGRRIPNRSLMSGIGVEFLSRAISRRNSLGGGRV